MAKLNQGIIGFTCGIAFLAISQTTFATDTVCQGLNGLIKAQQATYQQSILLVKNSNNIMKKSDKKLKRLSKRADKATKRLNTLQAKLAQAQRQQTAANAALMVEKNALKTSSVALASNNSRVLQQHRNKIASLQREFSTLCSSPTAAKAAAPTRRHPSYSTSKKTDIYVGSDGIIGHTSDD
ncbi:MAG: hypothetical protein COB66_02025 [Coxiella sp. (in: Bacteria)]|nr:MAG: hypothetical protein COB66_02025 [Coxiella sp. (in: g-proteobacteria)]